MNIRSFLIKSKLTNSTLAFLWKCVKQGKRAEDPNEFKTPMEFTLALEFRISSQRRGSEW